MARKKPLARTFYWSCDEHCWPKSQEQLAALQKIAAPCRSFHESERTVSTSRLPGS